MLCGGPKVSETPQKLHSDVTLLLLDMVESPKKYITSNISNAIAKPVMAILRSSPFI